MQAPTVPFPCRGERSVVVAAIRVAEEGHGAAQLALEVGRSAIDLGPKRLVGDRWEDRVRSGMGPEREAVFGHSLNVCRREQCAARELAGVPVVAGAEPPGNEEDVSAVAESPQLRECDLRSCLDTRHRS